MRKSEVAALLAFCAAYDQRTIGTADVEAWAEALNGPWVPDIDVSEAQGAVVAHYRENTQRITVADVLKRVKISRADRRDHTPLPPKRPPSPPTEEYLRARAEAGVLRSRKLEDRLAERKPEGAA